MDLVVGKTRARVSDSDLLGVGGEARVFRFRDHALKIFHEVDPARTDAVELRRVKIAKLRAFPQGLPAEVVAPLELVSDRGGRVIGYAMPAVNGADDLLRLSQRCWRQGVVSNTQVTRLFRNIHRVLETLHARSVIVGDLNDSNLMFAGERPWFIDTDSMQFGGYPCVVGHERFLDPRLYGVDLAARPSFDAGSDWYAYAVLLFGSLLYVHPYGGLHRGYPTQLRRAEARHSILRADVAYPKAAVHYRILPDDLLDWFARIFDHDLRTCFPTALLQMTWTRCTCGLEHARAVCPDCASVGVVVSRSVTRENGRCTARLIFRTSGRILTAAIQGALAYVYEEAGVIKREDGSSVLEQPLAPGMRFALSGPSTWVGLRGRLVRVQRGAVVERAVTGTLGTRSVFDANAAGCFRTEQEWLLEVGTGNQIGKILEGQTWIWAGERLGFGFYRAGLISFFFLFRSGRPGLLDVKLPTLDGRLVDAACIFDDHHALLSLATERDGRPINSMFLIGEDGTIKGRAQSAPEDGRMLRSLAGKALLDGRVVCSTDEGLLSLRVDAGHLVEGTLFTDTEPFAAAGVDLLPGPGGSVYVISTNEITQLTLA